jgi:hypothetical protein
MIIWLNRSALSYNSILRYFLASLLQPAQAGFADVAEAFMPTAGGLAQHLLTYIGTPSS